MILWKNMVIIGGALSLFYWLIAKTLTEREERQWLKTLYISCLVMMVTLLTWNPYLVTMAILIGTIVFAISKGVPPLATVFVLTALVPVMRYRIGGGGIALLDISTLSIAGLAIVIAAVTMPHAFRKNPTAKIADVFIILFIIAFSLLSARGFSAAIIFKTAVDQTLTYGAIYYAASRGRLKSINFLLASIVFIGGAVSVSLIVESLRHWPMFLGAYQLKGIELVSGRTLNIRDGLMRASGPFEDAIACSMFLSIVLLASWGQALQRSWKPVTLVAAAFTLAALWLTFSRTGLVSLAIGVTAMAILRRKWKEMAIAAIMGGMAFVLAQRISKGGASGTSDYRVEIFNRTLEVLRPHMLLGDNNAIRDGRLNDMIQGQGIVDLVNAYLGLLMAGGLVLISFFLLLSLSAMLSAWQASKQMDRSTGLAAQVASSQLIAYLVSLAFTSATDKNFYYVFLLAGLVTGLSTFAREAKNRTPAAPAHRGPSQYVASAP